MSRKEDISFLNNHLPNIICSLTGYPLSHYWFSFPPTKVLSQLPLLVGKMGGRWTEVKFWFRWWIYHQDNKMIVSVFVYNGLQIPCWRTNWLIFIHFLNGLYDHPVKPSYSFTEEHQLVNSKKKNSIIQPSELFVLLYFLQHHQV